MPMLCVKEAARRLGVKPRSISDLFYKCELREDLCPVMSGRRLIPEDYLPVIEAALRKHERFSARARF